MTSATVEPEATIELTESIDADEIDESFVALPIPEIASLEIDGETVLIVEGTPETHWLDRIGTIVWSNLDGSIPLGELIIELAAAFEADENVVRGDVMEMVRNLGRAGLLQGVARFIPEAHDHSVPGLTSLPLGTEVAPFSLPDLNGETVALKDLAGRELLLVNWSPSCGFCVRMAPALAELQPALRARQIEPILIALGDADANRALVTEHGLDCRVLLQGDALVEMFGGMGTPVAYLVNGDGRIASELALGADQVPLLAKQAAGLNDE